MRQLIYDDSFELATYDIARDCVTHMKKNTCKYLVDSLMFVDMCSLAGTGMLLAFVIPAGRAGGASKYFLGLHRHDWGNIHLYLSLVLLVLVCVHLWLNWAWILQFSKRYFGRHWKKFLVAVSLAWIIVLALIFLVVSITGL